MLTQRRAFRAGALLLTLLVLILIACKRLRGAQSKSVALVKQEDIGMTIAVDPKFVYYAAYPGGESQIVYRVPRSGGRATRVAENATRQKSAMAADGVFVYFMTSGGAIGKAPSSGGPVVELAKVVTTTDPPPSLSSLVASGDYVYWAEEHPAAIRRIAKSGGAVETLAKEPRPGEHPIVWVYGPHALAVDSNSVYWLEYEAVMKVTIGVNSMSKLASESWGIAKALTLDAGSVYWTTHEGTVGKVPKGGGAVTKIVSGLGSIEEFIATDGQFVYLIKGDELIKAPVTGGAVEVVSSAFKDCFAFAIDGEQAFAVRGGPEAAVIAVGK